MEKLLTMPDVVLNNPIVVRGRHTRLNQTSWVVLPSECTATTDEFIDGENNAKLDPAKHKDPLLERLAGISADDDRALCLNSVGEVVLVYPFTKSVTTTTKNGLSQNQLLLKND